MKVFIVGLGLMGGSYALGLKDKNYEVFGYDHKNDVVHKAMNDGLIKGSDFNDLASADLVILALYPKENIHFLNTHKQYFKKQLITDLAGTKEHLVKEVIQLFPNGIRYVSHHPMAGKEKSGYANIDSKMFLNANFLVVDTPYSNASDIEIIKKLGKDLGFGRITVLSPYEHDHLIAHTSQLTHLLAVGLMLIDKVDHTKDATGDSFRDLTRIAKINEDMWTELFLDNKDALIEKTDEFIQVLNDIKQSIINNDSKKIKQMLKESKEKRIAFDVNKYE